MVADQITQPLISLKNDGTLAPELIKEMPKISDDGLTYSFELKDNVKFHNGETVKTSDVKYSFERLLTEGVMGSMIDQIVGAQALIDKTATSLEGFKIIDDQKFDIVLEQPFSPFTSTIATAYVAIYPEQAVKMRAQTGVEQCFTVLAHTKWTAMLQDRESNALNSMSTMANQPKTPAFLSNSWKMPTHRLWNSRKATLILFS